MNAFRKDNASPRKSGNSNANIPVGKLGIVEKSKFMKYNGYRLFKPVIYRYSLIPEYKYIMLMPQVTKSSEIEISIISFT